MIASDLYAQTLSSLTAARSAMLSPAWITAQETQSPATRLQASQSLIQVQQAIAALSNAALSDIATQMAAQQEDLQGATKNLNSSLQDITKVQNVLNAVTSVINLVSQFVSLV